MDDFLSSMARDVDLDVMSSQTGNSQDPFGMGNSASSDKFAAFNAYVDKLVDEDAGCDNADDDANDNNLDDAHEGKDAVTTKHIGWNGRMLPSSTIEGNEKSGYLPNK